jgi:hypothetical protein
MITFLEDAVFNQLLWRLTDQTAGVTKLDSIPAATDTSTSHPVVDGIEWQVFHEPPNFADFLTVANAAGPLDPPEYAAFAFNGSGFPHPTTGDRPTDRQQVGAGHWGIHTADLSSQNSQFSYQFFLDRITRLGTRWPRIIPYDFEIRFTDSSYAWDAFTTQNFIQVPFELWDIGIDTPDDPTDDYRMVPWMVDDDSSGTFNMGAPNAKMFSNYDHSISGGQNDPFTDWIYWLRPQDTTPGESGYLAAEAEMIAGTYDGSRDIEVMARIVLVNLNGDIGEAPSGIYNQDLPETGTIFRIITAKPNFPGDALLVISPPPIAPASPALAAPPDGAVNQPTTLTLAWSASTGAITYRLQVSTSADFTTTIVDNSTITTTSRQVGPLANNTIYYWRVRAKNLGGNSEWSEIWRFTTIVQLPSQVSLITPAHAAVIAADTVQFTWQQSAPSITNYWLEIATDSLMTNPVIDSTLTAADTMKVVGQFLNMQTYWWRVRAGNAAGWGAFSEQRRFRIDIPTSVETTDEIPREFSLSQNYPNPFNPSTTIEYALPKISHVELRVYDILGNEVQTLVKGKQPAGTHRVQFDGNGLPAGVYFYRIKAGEFVRTKKLTLVK